jgi:muramoyltetrapeptide carboxypeptidase
MKFNRRNFLKTAGILGAASALPLKSQSLIGTTEDFDRVFHNSKKCITLPPSLKPGSGVAITCPASPTNMTETRYGRRLMKAEGCEVTNGYTVRWQKNEHRYLANTDEFRAEEFMSFIKNPSINAIHAARGGFGSIRMLNLLDYDIIAQNPKMIIGFSDITAILHAVYYKTGIVTYHGPVASSVKNEFSKKHLREICFYNKYEQPHVVPLPNIGTVKGGKAIGRLIGGNMSVIASLMGTPFEIQTDECILFLEEVSEDGYQFDRMIKQLELAGKFENVAGVMFGNFRNLNSRRPFYPNKGYSIKELMYQYFEKYDFPVIYGAPFGHVDNNITLPIGTYAEFDTGKKQLILHNSI